MKFVPEYAMRLPTTLADNTEQLVRAVIGCAIEVHRALGPGLVEKIYQDALCFELAAEGLALEREKPITLVYRGTGLTGQRLDLVVAGELIVEVKAVARLEPIHQAQVLSYLRASGLRIALLINFNVVVLRQGVRRFVL